MQLSGFETCDPMPSGVAFETKNGTRYTNVFHKFVTND